MARIRLHITDQIHSRHTTLPVYINAVNDPLAIAPSPMPAQFVPENMPMEPVMCEVSDARPTPGS